MCVCVCICMCVCVCVYVTLIIGIVFSAGMIVYEEVGKISRITIFVIFSHIKRSTI